MVVDARLVAQGRAARVGADPKAGRKPPGFNTPTLWLWQGRGPRPRLAQMKTEGRTRTTERQSDRAPTEPRIVA